MPILDAALAFALTMLVVATVVTQLVNVLRNTASLRREGLKIMLTDFFDKEIGPVVKLEARKLRDKLEDDGVEKITELAEKYAGEDIIGAAEAAKLVNLSTNEFIERIKRTEFGGAILDDLKDDADAVFDKMADRYEAVGRHFSQSFKNQSRLWTSAIALILAVVVNIDSIHIANSYIRDDQLTAEVLLQMDTVVARNEAAASDVETAGGDVEQLRRSVQQSREEIDYLRNSGFPVGWANFPHSGLTPDCSGQPDCANQYEVHQATFQQRDNLWGWFSWILGIVLTAFLAGLGAPFWYDAVKSITQFAQKSRETKQTA